MEELNATKNLLSDA
jgi:hypothetical protein